MSAFRKRQIQVEAMQWDGTTETASPIINWILSGGGSASYVCADPIRCGESGGDSAHWFKIQTLEGQMMASIGDWITRGVQGEFYPCKPDIFEATYEPVGDHAEAAANGWLDGIDRPMEEIRREPPAIGQENVEAICARIVGAERWNASVPIVRLVVTEQVLEMLNAAKAEGWTPPGDAS